MSVAIKYSSKNIFPLIAGIAGLVLLTGQSLYEFQPEAVISFPLPPFFSGLLITAIFIGLGYFFLKAYEHTEFYNVEELLQSVMYYGLVALTGAMLPEILEGVGLTWNVGTTYAIIYDAISFLLILIYFFNAAVLFKRLMMVKKNRWLDRLWKWLIGFIIVANIFNFRRIPFPDWLLVTGILFGGFLSLAFIVRQNWIALLTTRTKIFIILYLCIINLISFGLIQKLLDFNLVATMDMGLGKNVVLMTVVFLAGGYGLFSLLALLFNLPISSIIEANNNQLTSFRELTRSIESELNRQDILNILFKNCRENTQADAGWIGLSNRETGEEKILTQDGIDPKDLKRILFSYKYNPDHFKIDEEGFLYIHDLQEDEILQNHDLPFHSLLVFQININKQSTAKLFLMKKYCHGFDEYAIELVNIYVTQTKMSIENSNMLKETLEMERVKKDLEIGKNLQKRLLPSVFPQNSLVEITATSVSAEEVGGDYYDFHQISDSKYAFIIADVSGKGTTAAFHVAEMKGIFQSLILSDISPKKFLEKANEAVSRCFDKGMFITVIYMIIDLEERSLHYSRAGHCPILHYSHNGKLVQYLDDEGLGLGIIRGEKYNDLISDNKFYFQKGDVLLVYTDGVIEARNVNTNEEYGFERLKEKIKRNGQAHAENILEDILEDIAVFTGQQANRDDISMLVFKAK